MKVKSKKRGYILLTTGFVVMKALSRTALSGVRSAVLIFRKSQPFEASSGSFSGVNPSPSRYELAGLRKRRF